MLVMLWTLVGAIVFVLVGALVPIGWGRKTYMIKTEQNLEILLMFFASGYVVFAARDSEAQRNGS
jgi:hypothetical protein